MRVGLALNHMLPGTDSRLSIDKLVPEFSLSWYEPKFSALGNVY